jgi:uncharacterized protein YdeI (YjbR/CyaY-like superfamily)
MSDEPSESFNGQPVMCFKNWRRWEAWLSKHHKETGGVWIKISKKKAGIPTVTHLEALDVALCYGWIDAQAKPYEVPYYLRRFVQRRPRSTWSKINIAKVQALISAGRMRAPGKAAVEAAQADGRWDAAYESQKNATIPPEFAKALASHPTARTFFDALNKANRYAFIWRVATSRTPETRRKRIEKFIAMLETGQKFH